MSSFFSGLFHYRFGAGGAGSGAPGFIDDGDTITVANYAALPDAAANDGKLAWVLSTTGAFWTKKYSGWYISNGSSWVPADTPDHQYVVTDAVRADVDAADTLLIQAYDVNGTAYSTFATFTSADTPTGVIAPPTGGMLTLTASNTGLGAYDTNTSHILTIKPGSDLTAARTCELITGDANSKVVMNGVKSFTFAFTDPTASLTTGDNKAFFIVPSDMNGMDIIGVQADVATAPAGSAASFQLHNVTSGADILSTALTIDASETSSSTAATPAVINASEDDLTTGDKIRLDVDAVGGTAAKGGFITVRCKLP
jgi:hypothetical protein